MISYLFNFHLPPPNKTSLISLRATSFGFSLSYLNILDLILSLITSGIYYVFIKSSKKTFKPEISSIKAKSSKETRGSLLVFGKSMKTYGPFFSRSTIKSSSYSLWTSKCSITMLWHNLFRLSQYYHWYIWWLNDSSPNRFIWIP